MVSYRVSFSVDIPGDPPVDEVEAFISFELGERAALRVTHSALKNLDLQSCEVSQVLVSEA